MDEVLFDRPLRNGKPVIKPKPRSIKKFAKTVVGRGDGADLPTCDMRSVLGRRYREVAIELINDSGGLDNVSGARLSLIRRFAGATALCEQLEAAAVRGEKIDINEYALLTSCLVRIARIIGVARIPRDVGPSLGDLLRQDHLLQQQQDVMQAAEKRRQFEANARTKRLPHE